MSDRVRVIDEAVGELQCEVEKQQEEINRLTEMVQSLVVSKFYEEKVTKEPFSAAEIERHRRRCEAERDADNERGDY
jgi:hypothetical protein